MKKPSSGDLHIKHPRLSTLISTFTTEPTYKGLKLILYVMNIVTCLFFKFYKLSIKIFSLKVTKINTCTRDSELHFFAPKSYFLHPQIGSFLAKMIYFCVMAKIITSIMLLSGSLPSFMVYKFRQMYLGNAPMRSTSRVDQVGDHCCARTYNTLLGGEPSVIYGFTKLNNYSWRMPHAFCNLYKNQGRQLESHQNSHALNYYALVYSMSIYNT